MRVAPWLLALACLAACGRETSVAQDGRDTFLRYCAACHGPEGRGDGPLAASLTKFPADLTQLAKRNGGRYDERASMEAIDGRRQIAAHGTRDMPVWGAIFEEEGKGTPYPAYQSLVRSRFLVDYLATIQEGAAHPPE
jgi:mono/diheme cytochrome c family protein